jgi:hypothetical protein
MSRRLHSLEANLDRAINLAALDLGYTNKEVYGDDSCGLAYDHKAEQSKKRFPTFHVNRLKGDPFEFPDEGEATIKFKVTSRETRNNNGKENNSLSLEIQSIDPVKKKAKKKSELSSRRLTEFSLEEEELQPRKRGLLEKAALIGGGLYAAKTAAKVIGRGVGAGMEIHKGIKQGLAGQKITVGTTPLKKKLAPGAATAVSRRSKQWAGKSGAFVPNRKLMGLEARLDEALTEFTDPRPRNQQGMFADSTEAGANPDTMRKAYGSASRIRPDILQKLKRKLPRSLVAPE